MESYNRKFKGVWFPADIWVDKNLSFLEKGLLIEIDSLTDEESGQYCYASNQYFAEFFNCSQSSITNSISRLVKLGYIEVVGFDGRKRYLKSKIQMK